MTLLVIMGMITVASFGLAALFGWRLWQWERQLSRARVAIAYKGKIKMAPRLIDLLTWSLKIKSDDKRVTGQAIYKMGSTTVELRKPLPLPKSKTRTIKEKAA